MNNYELIIDRGILRVRAANNFWRRVPSSLILSKKVTIHYFATSSDLFCVCAFYGFWRRSNLLYSSLNLQRIRESMSPWNVPKNLFLVEFSAKHFQNPLDYFLPEFQEFQRLLHAARLQPTVPVFRHLGNLRRNFLVLNLKKNQINLTLGT